MWIGLRNKPTCQLRPANISPNMCSINSVVTLSYAVEPICTYNKDFNICKEKNSVVFTPDFPFLILSDLTNAMQRFQCIACDRMIGLLSVKPKRLKVIKDILPFNTGYNLQSRLLVPLHYTFWFICLGISRLPQCYATEWVCWSMRS